MGKKNRREVAREREVLEDARISFDVVTGDELCGLQARWREVFAAEVLRRTGHAVHLGFDWHALSHEFTPSESGVKARAAYEARTEREVIAIPDASSPIGEGYRCHGPLLPDFSSYDVLVVPPDFAWTMAFTHEDGWIGPFFAWAPKSVAWSRRDGRRGSPNGQFARRWRG